MQEELQVEQVHVAARVAGARRIQAHGPERVGKTAVDALDRIERKLALRQIGVGQIGQCRVALQVGQHDRRLDLGENTLEQRIENSLRVLELRAREKHGVTGNIGDEQKALLRHSVYSRRITTRNTASLAESCSPRAGELEVFPSPPCSARVDEPPSASLRS